MSTPSPATRQVAPAALHGLVAALFEHAGMSAAHASTVADALVWANLRGVDTHGVSRVARYLEFIDTGMLNPRPDMRSASDSPAVQVLEADRAAGAIAMAHASDTALAKAKFAGIGLVLVRGTTHTGSLGYFTESIARRGMTALALTASTPNMAYHGARAAGVSTAPVSIAVPGSGAAADPIVLDMATGIVSLGRLVQARRNHETLAPGLALDAAGNPTTDSQAAQIPLPLGGAKGSGLALMIEMLTSLAVGNPLIAEFFSDNPGARRHRQNALVLAIDVFRFCPEDMFRRDVARTVAALKALPADAGGNILMPGERGYQEAARRRRDGIPLPAGVASELAAAAATSGLPLPWTD